MGINALDSSCKKQKKMDLTNSVFSIFETLRCLKQSQFRWLKFIIIFISDSYCHLVHVQVQIIRKRGANFLCPHNKQKLCDMDSLH